MIAPHTTLGQDQIQVYTSPESGFLVNSFLIGTATGVLVIDTQFLVSPARVLRDRVAQTGRPLQAVLISHPHPDHFGGTAILTEGGSPTPVYATQSTCDGIKATEASKREFWTPVYHDEYPPSTILPDHVVTPGASFVIDGLELIVDELGAGESSAMAVIYLPQSGQLLVSDLVYNRVHPWLAEGRSEAWLQQLELVQTRYPQAQTVYPGHGVPGTLALLAEQTAYIQAFRDLVRDSLKEGGLSDDDKQRITQSMTSTYPGYPLQNLIGYNIEGVAGEWKSKLRQT